MASNVDKTRKAQMIREIMELMTQGRRYNTILDTISQKYEITRRTVRLRVTEAKAKYKEIAQSVDKDQMRGEILEKLHEVYKRALERNNHTAAVNALKELSKLTGIGPTELNISGTDIKIQINKDEEGI